MVKQERESEVRGGILADQMGLGEFKISWQFNTGRQNNSSSFSHKTK